MDSRITDKIRKLLALAGNNPSPEEAAAAFARAQELATRYRIELASIEVQADDPDAEMASEKIDDGTKMVPGWRKLLLDGIAHAFGVFVLLERDGGYTLAGRRGDLDAAKYMLAAIGNEIDRLARANAHGQGRRFATAYRVAAAVTVSKRIREQHAATIEQARQAGASSAALVKIEQSRSDAQRWFVANCGRELRLRTGCTVRSSSAAGRAAGARDGQRINIGGNTALGKGRLALGSGR